MITYRNIFPDTTQEALYNCAAWQDTDTNHIHTLFREVSSPGALGQPDRGKLVHITLNHEGEIIERKTIWEPESDELLLEDPRALCLGSKIVMGLTAVRKNGENYDPYPAVVTLNSPIPSNELHQTQVITNLGTGKNLTPISENTFFFRLNGENNNHKLAVITINEGGVEYQHDIVFPNNIPWAKNKIGTTIPPIWFNDKEALMIIHGIEIVREKYVYSIGRAKLIKNEDNYSVEVDPKPLITPDDFCDDQGKSVFVELHPERRVLYSCGGITREKDGNKYLLLYINVGDRATVEVEFSFEKLKDGWWK